MVRRGGSDLDPTDPAPVVSVIGMYECLTGVFSSIRSVEVNRECVVQNGGSTLDPADLPPVVGFSGS